MKNRLHLIFIFFLSFICRFCMTGNNREPISAREKNCNTRQNHLNFIKTHSKNETIFTQHHHLSHQKFDNTSSSAEKKFFSILTIVQITNLQCTVDSSTGLCMTSGECLSIGGSSIGNCANDYGTCCYKAIKCGESSSMNITHIQNADYPSTTSSSGSCTHTITRGSNVCKLRLDFIDFEISDPQSANNDVDNGMCLNDKMTVSGVATTQFEYLCGKMPPIWHFYLDVRDASNPTTFNFVLSSGVTKNRKWNIKVTQIDCDRKIPQGCGQYFTGTTGDPLYSFNWGNNDMYLHGMNYGICFRKEKGYCTQSFIDSGPSWVVCEDSLAFPTSDIGESNANTLATNGADTRDCNFAGLANVWPSPINTNTFGPVIIYHHTDQVVQARNSIATPATSNPGFYFTWTHNKC